MKFSFDLFFDFFVPQQADHSDIMPAISTSKSFRMIKRKFSPIHWVLLVLTLILASPIQALAQNDPVDPSTLELRQIPSAPNSSIDLANILLKISRQRDPALNISSLEAKLDKLTEVAKAYHEICKGVVPDYIAINPDHKYGKAEDALEELVTEKVTS